MAKKKKSFLGRVIYWTVFAVFVYFGVNALSYADTLKFNSLFEHTDFKIKMGGTIYEVNIHFNPEGNQSVLQQFRELLISEKLIENRIIDETGKGIIK